MMQLHRWAYLRLSRAQEWISERIEHNGEELVEYKQRYQEEKDE
jgi:hypothetical protein